MNISHLEAFCLAVKTGSITKTARELHISQPALSLQMQDLENNLQTILLARNNKGVTPTAMGEIVFNYSTKIIQLAENMRKEIERLKEDVLEELVVGASCTVGNYALPCSIYIFKEEFEAHDISLHISSVDDVVEKLISGSINIAVIEGAVSGPLKALIKAEGLQMKKVARDELVLVAPYEAWKDSNEISKAKLSELTFILREQGSGIRATIEETFEKNDIDLDELDIRMELNSTNAIISSVAAGNGVSILPKMALRKDLRHRTLKALKIEDMIFIHNIYLLYAPQSLKSKLSAEFINFLSSSSRGFC
jgi:LysR family transcriptional regulator, transcriptional activator of the cysJI operon